MSADLNKKNLIHLMAITCTALTLWSHPLFSEEGSPAGKRMFDLRLSAGAGAFYYPQYVNGGYYVNNTPYDLIWHGWQTQVTGEAQVFIPGHPNVSLGIGAAYFLALNPAGTDLNVQVNVKTGGDAKGGFAGMSASWWIEDTIRISVIAGYGGTGVSDYYGGYGFTYSIAAAYLFPSGNIIGGLGFRFIHMRLKNSGDENTRAEKGDYFALLLEASVDWAPRF